MRIGKISQFISPGYSYCGKCHTTWNFVQGHTTKYNDACGMFPLCEACWKELTPKQRLPYYKDLWDSWQRDSITYNYPAYPSEAWEMVEKNVLAGL